MSTILVCHPTAQLFNIPCVVQLMEEIAKYEEHAVHFARVNSSNSTTPKGELSTNIVSHDYPFKMGERKEPMLHWLIGYSLYSLYIASVVKPNLFIGMGSKGLFVAWLLSLLTSKPFFYYNLEFYTSAKRPLRHRIWNTIERAFLKRSKLLIIHDERRCKIYKELIGYQDIKCALFPNTPISVNIKEADIKYIKSTFKIKDDKKYLVYSGGLYPKVGLEKLCDCLNLLPEQWCLILQSYDGVDKISRTDYILRYISSSRLIINPNPLTPSEYGALLSMCHIGIAFYRGIDPNMRNVGLSSGKIAAYWKYGLPVLVNDIPFYKELFVQNKGGAIYDKYENIAHPLLNVINDYEDHRQAALIHFEKFFSLDDYSLVITEAIKELT